MFHLLRKLVILSNAKNLLHNFALYSLLCSLIPFALWALPLLLWFMQVN